MMAFRFVALAACLSCAAVFTPRLAAETLRYENLELVVYDEVIIAPASVHVGAANMMVHPDGSVWINSTTTDPGLYRSVDRGKTWTSRTIKLRDALGEQYIAGLAATRDGRLWIIHQAPPTGGGLIPNKDAFVSVSTDQGATWRTTEIEYPNFAPTAPRDPYDSMEIAWCHPNVVERPDGTVMFSASMRYADWGDYRSRISRAREFATS